MAEYQFRCPLHQVDLHRITPQPSLGTEKISILTEDLGSTEHSPGIVRNTGPPRYELPMNRVTSRRNLLGYQAGEGGMNAQALPYHGLFRQ